MIKCDFREGLELPPLDFEVYNDLVNKKQHDNGVPQHQVRPNSPITTEAFEVLVDLLSEQREEINKLRGEIEKLKEGGF